jgi:hypothetical protein
MILHDTRRLHRQRDPERLRYFGKQESSTSIKSPFGELPFRTAGTISNQQVQPLLLGLGLGTGKRAEKLQATSRWRAGALARRSIDSAVRPGVLPGGAGAGDTARQRASRQCRSTARRSRRRRGSCPNAAGGRTGLAATQEACRWP